MIEIGDWVKVIDEKMTGEVVRRKNDAIWVIEFDGLEFEYLESQLMKIENEEEIKQVQVPMSAIRKDVERKKGSPSTAKQEPDLVVDLHAHKLVGIPEKYLAGELLEFQIREFRRQVELATKKNYRSVIFIHGVGKGTLRKEIHHLLRTEFHYTFSEASFRHFGEGATQVFFR